jgi:hypothetical protein
MFSFRILSFIGTLLSFTSLTAATYIVTCHSDGECGSVCGRYSSDIVAPTEGIFSTSCSCGNGGGVTYKCTAFGVQVSECSDGRAPQCSTACGQKVCISKDGKKTTGTILSACPKHHPENVKNCCSHSSSRDYCTCVIQDTLDLNWQPYQALGNTNGYSSSATWGACSSQLESLQIHINTTRAALLVKPFVKSGQWCNKLETNTNTNTNVVETVCENITSETDCNFAQQCVYCSSNKLANKCYRRSEALVLYHIARVEKEFGFTCSAEDFTQ